MTKIVTSLYDTYTDASNAARLLEDAAIPGVDVSVVSNNSDGWYDLHDKDDTTTGDALGAGAGVGAALGGAGGLLAGLGLLAIPGVGPVVAAGWLASTVAGAAAGAVAGGATGGVIGAMTSAGVPADEAHVYAEGVRRGSTLVSARVPDEQEARVRSLLDASKRVDVTAREKDLRQSGWEGFDETAPPYDAAQIREERRRRGVL